MTDLDPIGHPPLGDPDRPRGYLHGVLYALDVFANAVTGGHPRETISSRLGKRKLARGGRLRWTDWGGIAKPLDAFLDLIDKGHSLNSIIPHSGRPPRPPHGGNDQ